MVQHLYKQKPSIPVIEHSERDDLVQFTAQKLKAQSDELLAEFTRLLGTETNHMEDMATKACKLMAIFEQDEEEFSNDL